MNKKVKIKFMEPEFCLANRLIIFLDDGKWLSVSNSADESWYWDAQEIFGIKESVTWPVEYWAIRWKTSTNCSQKLTALIIPKLHFNIKILQSVLCFVESTLHGNFFFFLTWQMLSYGNRTWEHSHNFRASS